MSYEKVPNIISCKDLDYLSDIYNWNFIASKYANESSCCVKDEEIKNILYKAASIHSEHCKYVINILK